MEEMHSPEGEITQGSITRLLAVGFSLVIVMLALGGSIAIHNIILIEQNAAKLVGEQRLTRHLIEGLQDEQQTLSAIFYTITGDPDGANPEMISRRLTEADAALQRMEIQAQPVGRQRALWGELMQSSHAFGSEARRLLADNDFSTVKSRELFRRHEQVVFVISRLAGYGFQSVTQAEAEIGQRATKINGQSLVLLCASLVLAVACGIFTVVQTRRLFRRMAWQEGELTQVSWHMLADQESIARRFAHELHDELGQVLAAVKSNLAAIPHTPANSGRLIDTTGLVDNAIGSVRQLSQLLRPMILDDFGLDAGLHWLCEGFMQRTGVAVDYQSNFHGRLPDQTETHLFRIAQEALTNVARHSNATRVKVELEALNSQIRLIIADNGRGIQNHNGNGPRGPSLGMSGMRARARAAGGRFQISTPPDGGLQLEAELPITGSPIGEENEHHSNTTG
ncbi:MAG: ATP-binding protein [Terriglobia bacterium]